MEKNRNEKIRKLCFAAVMAAMIYVSTLFLKVEIPTPLGTMMLKAANALCLIAGILFGGVYGGAAAGIGSAVYDLTNPAYIASAPYTLVQFFLMGAVCGWISHARGADGKNMRLNAAGIIAGTLANFIFYVGRKLITALLLGNSFGAALVLIQTNVIVSFINGIVAVVIALVAATPLKRALAKAHVL